MEKYHRKKFNMFNIFAQIIYCWYTLEPPHIGTINMESHSCLKSSRNIIIAAFLMIMGAFCIIVGVFCIIMGAIPNIVD